MAQLGYFLWKGSPEHLFESDTDRKTFWVVALSVHEWSSSGIFWSWYYMVKKMDFYGVQYGTIKQIQCSYRYEDRKIWECKIWTLFGSQSPSPERKNSQGQHPSRPPNLFNPPPPPQFEWQTHWSWSSLTTSWPWRVFQMFSQRAGICILLTAPYYFTVIRFSLIVCPCVLEPVTWIWISLSTPWYWTTHTAFLLYVSDCESSSFSSLEKLLPHESCIHLCGPLTSVSSHVDQHLISCIEALPIFLYNLPTDKQYSSLLSTRMWLSLTWLTRSSIKNKVLAAILPFTGVELR